MFKKGNTQQNENTINNTVGNTIETTTSNDVDEQELKIEVLNGSGKSSNLSKVIELLKENGYNVTKTGTTNSTKKTSIINRTDKSVSTTQQIKKIIGVGVTSKKSSNNKVDYTIIIGQDYK